MNSIATAPTGQLIEIPQESYGRRDFNAPVVQQESNISPMYMLSVAVNKGMDAATIKDLMDLSDRYEANEARKAFVAAMAEFKSEPIEIFKDSQVRFKTDKGVTEYMHASIGNVVGKIVGGLARHGFSHRWVPNRSEGGMLSITCVITHRLGHSESTTLEAGLDQSGGKNNIQAMISTKTYLERHTLLAATGLATKDQPDDDGQGSQERGSSERTEQKTASTDRASGNLPPYPPENFEKNFASWSDAIRHGKNTAGGIIAKVQTKGILTAEQQNRLHAVKKIDATSPATAEQMELIAKHGRATGVTSTEIFKKFDITTLEGISSALAEKVLAFINNPLGE